MVRRSHCSGGDSALEVGMVGLAEFRPRGVQDKLGSEEDDVDLRTPG